MTWTAATAKTRRVEPSWKHWNAHGYQRRASDFLQESNAAALFLDPGLGKTSITLDAFSKLHAKGVAKKMLVIAPLRVCQLVWRQEAEQWEQFRHLRFSLIHGSKKAEALSADADVFLINPEGIAWLDKELWGKKFPFDTLVIDELTKFKNARAVRHKLLRPRLKKVKRRWGLTGTPIPNGYLDLFGQMLILDDGAALTKYITHYRERYFEKDFNGFDWHLRRGADKQIEKRIEPYVLRMAAKDYLELPPLVDNIIEVEMTPKSRKIYDQMKKDAVADLEDGEVTAGNAAAVYSKLKQMANGAVYVGDGLLEPRRVVHIHDAKVEALQELVEEMAGNPILVAYEFNHDLERLNKVFPDAPSIGSGVSTAEAERIEAAWNRNEIPVLFAHPASAGHGLNLQKGSASHIAWFSATWDYELYDQFIRRIFRQGNEAHTVYNHILSVKDTVDDAVRDALANKETTQTALLDALNAELLPKEIDMVRKLSRKSTVKKSQREDEPEDVEEDEDLEDEEESSGGRGWGQGKTTRRRKTSTAKKLRGEEQEPDEDEDEGDEDGEESPSEKAKALFKKALDKRKAPEPEDEEDEVEEDPEPEEKPKRTRSKAKSKPKPEPEEDDAPFATGGEDALDVLKARIVAAAGSASAEELLHLSNALAVLTNIK